MGYERSLRIWEAAMGPSNAALASSLENLAVAYASEEKFEPAVPLFRRALALYEKTTAESMNNLSQALEGKGDPASAEALCRRAIELAERIPVLQGPANVGEDDVLRRLLRTHVTLLLNLNRKAEAAKAEARLKALTRPPAK